MRIEADYSDHSTTRSVLKWIAVGVALHVALCAPVFCEDKVVTELSFDILHCCWLLVRQRRKRGLS